MSKFCQKCGRPMADGMRFCEGCGAPAAAAPQQPVQQPVYQQPVQQPVQRPVYQQPAQQPVQRPVYQQPVQQPAQQPVQRPAYQQPAQQPVYQQPVQQPAYQQAAPVGTAPAPAKAPKKAGGFDINKIIDQVKLVGNGTINRCKVDKPFMYKCIGIAAGAVVVLILLVVLLFSMGNSYTTPIDNLIDVTFEGKANKIKNLAPDEYWEYYEDEYGDDIDDLIDDYEDEWDDMDEYFEDYYGKNYKVTYKVTDKDELSKKKLRNIGESLDDKYGIDEDSVTEGYKLEVELTIKGSEDDDETEMEIYVVKIDGKWYAISWSDYSGASFILDF